jgi:hypothetical protein
MVILGKVIDDFMGTGKLSEPFLKEHLVLGIHPC